LTFRIDRTTVAVFGDVEHRAFCDPQRLSLSTSFSLSALMLPSKLPRKNDLKSR